MHCTGAFLRLWLGTLACSAAVATPASALPGDLDPTFGTGGTVVTDLGGPELATGAALQADGAIVITGSASGRLLVARYRPDGTPDPAFSGDGFVVTSLGAISGRAVALQPDGAIVVAAATNTGPSPENVAILRYTPQGVLDGGFDGDGIAIVDIGGREIPTDLAITPDGAIVATARVLSGAPEDLYAIRLRSDGSPDAGFGGDGIANVDLGSDDAAEGVVAQPDGRVVLSGFTAGGANADFVLTRLNPDGSPDPGFGAGGVTLTDQGAFELGFGIARDAAGRLIVSGLRAEGVEELPAVARYDANGSLDPRFAGDGFTELGQFPDAGGAGAVTVQLDEKVLYAGNDFYVYRLTADGQLDLEFGDGGRSRADLGDHASIGTLLVQDDGAIVAVGSSDAGPQPEDVVLARFAGGDIPVCRGRKATLVALPGTTTRGSPGDDVIVGTAGRDRIRGGAGRDRVCGLGKADRVNGGGGPDSADGGPGKDVLRGAGGRDALRGGAGNDKLAGGAGRDTLVGGKGKRDRCAAGRGDRVRGC